MARRELSIDALEAGVREGDRRVLARAITLVESRRAEDRDTADELIARLLPATGGGYRIGVTGVPGVGKSTLLEVLGSRLCDRGLRVAVLAVDPSSPISGGSVLGDKTRMERLSRHERAFVRPSPGGEARGGVAAATREAILLCEAAGYDVVFVETIGVGQSETALASMVDDFILLALVGAGDELQGIKRGVLELVDAVVFTKADGEQQAAAEAAARELAGALRILRGPAAVDVGICSARTAAGLDELFARSQARIDGARQSGRLAERRRAQAVAWFERALDERIRARFFAGTGVREALAAARAEVAAGRSSPTAAARRLVDR